MFDTCAHLHRKLLCQRKIMPKEVFQSKINILQFEKVYKIVISTIISNESVNKKFVGFLLLFSDHLSFQTTILHPRNS